MGKLINASVYDLRPTQVYLFQETINHYKKNRNLLGVLPIPVVEDICFDSKYAVLDGHHNTSLSFIYNTGAKVWVAKDENDLMPYDLFSDISESYIDACNKQIKRRFNSAMFYMPTNPKGNDISTFDLLIKNNQIKF